MTGNRLKTVHRRPLIIAAAVAVVAAMSWPAAAQSTSERIERLERELRAVKSELNEMKRGPGERGSTRELERKVEILAEEIERLKLGEAAAVADASEWGMGPAASKIYRTGRGVSVGGYGEMRYQNFASERDDDEPSGKTDEFDFVRAIVYVGYKFSDKWLFNSEIEFEHASTSKSGSASVEFAYVDYLHRPEFNFRAGMLLLPMGFINELHEPTTWLGSNRPETERRIIPSTWRENGFGVFGSSGPLSYRTYLVNGLNGEKFDSSGLRGGRQKGSQAKAEDLAWVGRLDYSRPGVLFGGSLYFGNSGQGVSDDFDVLTTIAEGHVQVDYEGLQVRALAAVATLDDVAELNAELGLEGSDSIGESLFGAYFEAGYDVFSRGDFGDASLTPFIRYERINTQDDVPAGFARSGKRDRDLFTIGVSFQPIDQIVFKADWRNEYNDADTGLDQFNLSMGYIF